MNIHGSGSGLPGNARRAGVFVASLAAMSMVVAACGSSSSGESGNTGALPSGQSGSSQSMPAPNSGESSSMMSTGGESSSMMQSSGAGPSSSSMMSSGGGSSSMTSSSGGESSAPESSSGGTSDITAKNVELPDGTPGKGKPTITVGDKNFSEELLLGQLYKDALEAKGFTVKLKPNIGSSATIDTAFKSGKINLYPEYLGEIVTTVAGKEPQKKAEDTYAVAKKFEESQRDATILKQTPFQDVDVAFVSPKFAKKYKLKTIGDLTNVGPKGKGVTYVAPTDYRTRKSGLKGLHEVYGLSAIKFTGVEAGQQYKAFDKGAGNLGDAFSTNGIFSKGVEDGKYVSLKDTKGIYGFQHVAPVVKKALLDKEGDAFAQTLNWVDSLLTLDAMQKMNIAISVNHHEAKAVAQAFLQANGLK